MEMVLVLVLDLEAHDQHGQRCIPVNVPCRQETEFDFFLFAASQRGRQGRPTRKGTGRRQMLTKDAALERQSVVSPA